MARNAYTRRPNDASHEGRGSEARLQLDLVAVGIVQVERGAVAVRAEAPDDATLERGAFRLELARHAREVVRADREAEVVEAAARLALGGRDEVDQVLAEPELDERELLVHALELAAEDVLVEAPGARLVAHAQHDVVEAERLDRHGLPLYPAMAASSSP